MGLIEKLMANCKKATYLIEKQHLEPLDSKEQVKLKIHLVACSWCRTYEKQSKNMQLLMANVFKQSSVQTKQLNQQFKDELHILITEKLKEK